MGNEKGKVTGKEEIAEKLENRIAIVEKNLWAREKEERKRNIIVKGVQREKGDWS